MISQGLNVRGGIVARGLNPASALTGTAGCALLARIGGDDAWATLELFQFSKIAVSGPSVLLSQPVGPAVTVDISAPLTALTLTNPFAAVAIADGPDAFRLVTLHDAVPDVSVGVTAGADDDDDEADASMSGDSASVRILDCE